jgi:crossover junction endodeoxyribonuclease RusA
VLTIVAYGVAATQGSAIPVVSKSTGRPMLKKDNEKSQVAWRANVRDEVRRVMGDRAPLEGPVVLAITFTRPKPVSAPKRKPTWPHRKPDWDKLARAVSDGLKDGGAYMDDAQVVRGLVIKDYPVAPEDYRAPDPDEPAEYMLGLWGGPGDLLHIPGVVIRLAHLTEFPGTRSKLERAGLTPADVEGGGAFLPEFAAGT